MTDSMVFPNFIARPPVFASGGHAAPACAAKTKRAAMSFGDIGRVLPGENAAASDLLLTNPTNSARQQTQTSPATTQA
jgi:hypothetical protein